MGTSEKPEAAAPFNVRCYGCGGRYDALDESESQRHTHHLGPALVGGDVLADWLDECQRERDRAVRSAAELNRRLGECQPVSPAAASDDPGAISGGCDASGLSDAELVATVEACEARRLELLAELSRVHRDRVAAVAELKGRHKAPAVAALLGVSRQQVYRLLRG